MGTRGHWKRVGMVGLCVAIGCGPQSPSPTVVSLVPTDYATRFVEVRNCRATIDHQNMGDGGNVTNIRVLVNPESAAAYRANTSPLPASTVVIKEESDAADCSHVTAFTVMAKQSGYDSPRGDWHWQRVLASSRAVLEDGHVNRCITCHQTYNGGACLRRDWMCTDP